LTEAGSSASPDGSSARQ